jgi:ATP-dependent DNA ligase
MTCARRPGSRTRMTTARADPAPAPMLARLTRTLPGEGHLFEPKWDGFRCVATRSDAGIELWSRHGRPFTRYFPELLAALRDLPADRWTVDGEVLVRAGGSWDFAALMGRLHPAASRVEQLAESTPATFFVFDLMAVEGDGLCERPFRERRRRLEALMRDAAPPLCLTPQTATVAVAERWLAQWRGGGIDGVMAKPVDGPYRPGSAPF